MHPAVRLLAELQDARARAATTYDHEAWEYLPVDWEERLHRVLVDAGVVPPSPLRTRFPNVPATNSATTSLASFRAARPHAPRVWKDPPDDDDPDDHRYDRDEW
jgi:hypothetical protein